MEIILDSVSLMAEIQSLNWCKGMLQCIFLSDLVTADERYLESFVFNPGPIKLCSNHCFPWECPTKRDWDTWFNFWHNYATTGNKLRVPLGWWTHPTHRKWLWYASPTDDLHRIEDGFVHHYLPWQSICHTGSRVAYTLTWKEQLRGNHVMGQPESVQGSYEAHVNKLNMGPTLARGPQQPSNFWDFSQELARRVDVGRNWGWSGYKTWPPGWFKGWNPTHSFGWQMAHMIGSMLQSLVEPDGSFSVKQLANGLWVPSGKSPLWQALTEPSC